MITTPAVIGLGGNVGDVVAAFGSALAAVDRAEGNRVIAVSSLYRTAPVGGVEQDDFLNAAALLATSLDPSRLMALLLEVEQEHGRERTEQWGPRTLDLDLLWFGGLAIAAPGLIVPHPRLHERRFALQPLVELLPTATDQHGTPYVELLAALPEDGVAVVGEPGLVYHPA